MLKQVFKLAAVFAPAVLMIGCATHTAKPYDYRAFEASNPHSILVLPPLNNSPEVGATESVYSTVTYPLAEAGYYVLPVSLVSETFKQNGLTTPADIHNVDPAKLQEIFGADAALYMTVEKYGSTYNVLSSVTMVSASAKLVDLKTKALLWDGKATVVDDGNRGGNNGGIIGMLVKAAVTQILNSSTNRSHEVAAQTNSLLLTGGNPQGILYGPRSPKYTGRDGIAPGVASNAAPGNKAIPRASVATPKPAALAAVPPAPTPPAATAAAIQPATAVKPASAAVQPTVAAKPVAVAAVQPVAAVAPVVAQAQPAVTTPAQVPATQLSAAEQSYADALTRAQSKYQSLDPGSHWYRQELYDWVMARKDEHVRAGKAPDVALKLALAAMEGR